MRALACLVAIVVSAALLSAQRARTLDIYVVDVEGGNATLFVSPSHESLLIDTGNAGAAAARDAGRIMDAVKDAGLQRIDHLIITHWHGDHFGGLAELAAKIPIAEFIDHGPNVRSEGGNATLFVSPSHESLLIDTGNAGAAAARDAGRIMDAVKDAGLQRIDHLIITHWHGDHFGGLAELAAKIPIAEFIDHGPNV